MRWLLNVSAEKRNSTTGSGVTRRRHGTSVGAGSRRGAWLRSPAFTSSEHGAPLLFEGEAGGHEDALDRRREHERAGAAGLQREVGQLGVASKHVADPDRPVDA